MVGFYSSPPLCGEEESQTPLTHTPSSLSSSPSLISPPPRLSLQPSPAPVSGEEWPPRHRPGSGDEGLRMESGIQMHGSRAEGTSSSAPPPTHEEEEAIWHMNLRGGEAMDMGPYPERPGEPDCAYYIRTGLCKYGMTCRYNHPPNRKLVVSAARIKGGYPERAGQPECQYYLKTGTCKFGATCKFHHPRDKAGIAGRVQLNILGYPLRMNEKECAYYLRTGQCKFGNTCKFNHPQPSNAMVSVRGSPGYPSAHTPTSTGQQSYPGGLTNWPLSRAFVPSPRWQGPSNYAQLILPQGLVQVPNWTPYPGHVGSVSTPETLQRQSEATSAGSQGGFSSYQPGAIPMGLYSLQRENIFPERPDQPECQFYMKTGDCKFGAVCKFHHPRDRSIPVPNCTLSPMGLPLRQGEPMCIFYSRYGICKFGPNCKFDHPMGSMTFGVPSSSGPPALTLPSDRPVKVVAGKPRRSPSESQPDENTEAEGS